MQSSGKEGITISNDQPFRFTINLAAVAISLVTIGAIAGLRRWRPSWPGMLMAVGLASLAAALFSLPVETLGTRFGGIPRTLPIPALPAFTPELAMAVLPDAVSFALLGGIEPLLSAVVVDGMTGRRHRSNCELVAQGFANIGSALFGGICVTGGCDVRLPHDQYRPDIREA